MFGFMKKKRHKDDDFGFDDIKSSVMKKDYYEPEPVAEPMPPEPSGFESPRPSERFGEPISLDQGTAPMGQEPRAGRDYDILERLNMIETNLLAIRSQTETINERLKNLEMKLTRRY